MPISPVNSVKVMQAVFELPICFRGSPILFFRALGVELSNSTLTPLTAGQLQIVPFTLSFLDSSASLLVNPKAARLGCFQFTIFFITKPELKKYQYEHFKYSAGIAAVTIAAVTIAT